MSSPNLLQPSPAVMSMIAQAIRSVRFGMIRIMVHDTRVVQIEKVEKIRMEPSADLAAGSQTLQAEPHRITGGVSDDDQHGRQESSG